MSDGLEVRDLGGGSVTVTSSALSALRAGFRGPMCRPGDSDYEDLRKVWNAMIGRRPALFLRCTGTADVVQAVRFAREHGLLVSVRGGGHNIAGLSMCEGGLVIDLSLMKGVSVDPERRIARAQPGCTLGELDRETQLHGLAAVLGFVSTTGIAGLTRAGASAISPGGTAGRATPWSRWRWCWPTEASCARAPARTPSSSSACAEAAATSASSRRSSTSSIRSVPRSSQARSRGAATRAQRCSASIARSRRRRLAS